MGIVTQTNQKVIELQQHQNETNTCISQLKNQQKQKDDQIQLLSQRVHEREQQNTQLTSQLTKLYSETQKRVEKQFKQICDLKTQLSLNSIKTTPIEKRIYCPMVPLNKILEGNSFEIRVDTQTSQLLVTIPEGVKDGEIIDINEHECIQIVTQSQLPFHREGDDLIGEFVFNKDDMNKLWEKPMYPLEEVVLQPVPIGKEAVLKNCGFYNRETKKRGSYIIRFEMK